MSKRFKPTGRIKGWFFILDNKTGSLVGVRNSKGVLKPKSFKTYKATCNFIDQLDMVVFKENFKKGEIHED